MSETPLMQPMDHTTLQSLNPTISFDGKPNFQPPEELIQRYDEVVHGTRLSWTAHLRLERLLGKGGQGMVYLSRRRGSDEFTVPIALKIFSPARFESTKAYNLAMQQRAKVASRVAQIQHDNLIGVQDFYDRNQIRVMAMDWIDGYDLRRLLCNKRLDNVRQRVSNSRWKTIKNVIATAGESQPRLKPGVAVAIVRDCLSALAALHREGIVHGDIKPGNIMLKLTGTAKIIDIGSAFEIDDPPPQRTCTPTYAAPEVLDGTAASPASDVASLGYVLLELLAGRPLFPGKRSFEELVSAKRALPQRLDSILPEAVTVNTHLMNFCRKMIAADPALRFANAESADLDETGAAAFLRQLVMSNLASEYTNELRVWLMENRELDEAMEGSNQEADE